ncbi:lipoprotein insertase outer membrane protein LolB [Vibrio algivorus]|uniref:lipoprotein insertase outer membrane protein LolB n=1 Tax=Vibrio algivorus TaxID=1667024 RepID=UPI0016436202|nr:lipoprotein insertase outer membrane protein LolB [Vibrio algivorus]
MFSHFAFIRTTLSARSPIQHLTTILLATFVLILSGCSSVPPTQENYSVDWQNQKTVLEQLDTFKATGKIGYKDPEHRQSLNFILKHSNSFSELKLLSVFGQTVLTVQMTPTGAMVTNSDGKVQTAQQANALIQNLTGLAIPVSQLPDWIKGLPTQADNVTFNQSNTVESLNKMIDGRDWTLSYLSYQSVMNKQQSITLPKQMLLHQSDTEIKILISKWIL